MSLTGDHLAEIALNAGRVIIDIYNQDFSVSQKSDASPVTDADQKAEALILNALAAIEPKLPVIAEEAVAAGNIPEHGSRFALVDPLDGTKEFVNRRGEFTVNIAIIENGRPTSGVVYAPALSRLFVAETRSVAWYASAEPGAPVPLKDVRSPLRIRRQPSHGISVVASKSHATSETDDFLAHFDIVERRAAGSSLKFCLIAAGEADLYPRMGRTMEWDTAAGQAVVEAAGGRVLTIDGKPLLYGKRERDYDNPHFIVYGDVDPISF